MTGRRAAYAAWPEGEWLPGVPVVAAYPLDRDHAAEIAWIFEHLSPEPPTVVSPEPAQPTVNPFPEPPRPTVNPFPDRPQNDDE